MTKILNTDIKSFYTINGFVSLNKVEKDCVRLIEQLTLDPSTKKYYETDEKSIRSYYINPINKTLINWLQSETEIVNVVRQLLGKRFYIYQAKINLKNDISTSVWPHHRDYYFWKYFDGVRKPDLINLVILLDNIRFEKGALTLLRGSNNFFFDREKEFENIKFSIDKSASHELAFEFNEEEIKSLEKNHKPHYLTGDQGNVTAFHPNTIHFSDNGKRGNQRKLFILTLNSVDNYPHLAGQRPPFLCPKDVTPI